MRVEQWPKRAVPVWMCGWRWGCKREASHRMEGFAGDPMAGFCRLHYLLVKQRAKARSSGQQGEQP